MYRRIYGEKGKRTRSLQICVLWNPNFLSLSADLTFLTSFPWKLPFLMWRTFWHIPVPRTQPAQLPSQDVPLMLPSSWNPLLGLWSQGLISQSHEPQTPNWLISLTHIHSLQILITFFYYLILSCLFLFFNLFVVYFSIQKHSAKEQGPCISLVPQTAPGVLACSKYDLKARQRLD